MDQQDSQSVTPQPAVEPRIRVIARNLQHAEDYMRANGYPPSSWVYVSSREKLVGLSSVTQVWVLEGARFNQDYSSLITEAYGRNLTVIRKAARQSDLFKDN